MLSRRNFLTAAVGVAAAGGLAACAKEDDNAAGGSSGDGSKAHHARLLPGRRGERLAYAPTPSPSRTAAKAAGIDLKFSDAQQKQENQIKAIRTFITAEGRRHRLLAGGRDRLGHGAEGGQGRRSIPVILTDRAVELRHVPVHDLHRLGLRRRRASRAGEMARQGHAKAGRKGPVNIVELRGHHRLRPGQRPQEGLRRGHRRRTRTT